MAASKEPPSTSDLPDVIRGLQDNISAEQVHLSQARLSLTNEIRQLHDLYRQIMQASIRILEQTIHGAVSRGARAKADYLATMAEAMSKKISVQKLQLLQQAYSSEVQEALKAKADALQTESAGLRMKIRWAEDKLEQYRKTRGMGEMVREYEEIVNETERVRDEIERLESKR
jgi:hypothetical protein